MTKNYQQLQFSAEEEEKLIDFVKAYPVLYSVKNKSYKDIQLKESIWQQIAEDLQRTVSDCKIKWKHIRDYYQRMKRAGKKHTGKGKRYANLEFLPVSLVERETNSNLRNKEINTTESDDENLKCIQSEARPEDGQQQPQKSEHEIQPESQPELQLTKTQHVHTQQRVIRSPHPGKSQRSLYKRVPGYTRERNSTLKEIQKGRKERQDMVCEVIDTQYTAPTVNNSVDMFFQSMAAVVNTFPPRLVAKTRLKVCNIITEMELQALNEQMSIEEFTCTPTYSVSILSDTMSQPSSPFTNVIEPCEDPIAVENQNNLFD